MQRTTLLLVGLLLLLSSPRQSWGQGCSILLTPHFSTYTSVASDNFTITSNVTIQGYASIGPGLGCPMNSATHKGSAYNKLSSTVATNYGTPVCATCYLSASNTEEIGGDPGVLYPFSWSGCAVCSLAGTFWCSSGSSNQTVIDPTPVLTGISPSDWTAGTTQSVTFSSHYFGTNAPTLSFSPGAGIGYTLSSYNDTQIVASVTVASGTPNEDVDVSVTNNGYGGLAFDGGAVGESPTSAPIYATVHAPIAGAPEVTVIGWINGNAPDLQTLPAGNMNLVTQLNKNSVTCAAEVGAWIAGATADVHGPVDQDYANDWLIKYSANPAPPSSIDPKTQLTAGKYRMMNDFGGTGGGFHALGKTPDPCAVKTAGLKAIIYWTSDGQPSQYDGASGTSPSGRVYQLAEGRVGMAGQLANQTLNSRTTPWIWSVVKFDSSSNPTYSEHGVFPTYSIYVNGSLVTTIPQIQVSCYSGGNASACFSGKDATFQLTPSQIQ